jgi:hypothetical protein
MRTIASLSIVVVGVALIFAGVPLPAGERSQIGKMAIREVFNDVQNGIAQGNVAIFSPHFHNQVRVTVQAGETGLYMLMSGQIKATNTTQTDLMSRHCKVITDL